MKKKYLFSALTTGAMMALAFPPLKINLIGFLALVPLLMMFREDVKNKWLYVYITFFLYHGGTNWWISSFQDTTDPYLMATGFVLDFLHPIFFFLPFWGFFYIKRKVSYKLALFSFPFLWTAFEWLHSLGDLGYAWQAYGITQINFLGWIQFIDITGIFGASFFLMWSNVILTIFTIKTKESDLSFGKVLRTNKLYTTIWVLIIALPGIYGFISLSEYEHNKLMSENENINVAVVQPNFDPWKKWDVRPLEMIKKHQAIQDSLFSEMEGNIDLAVWSETAIPYISNSFNVNHRMPILEKHINSTGMALLTGFADFIFYDVTDPDLPFDSKKLKGDSTRRYQSFNSALLLNAIPNHQDNPQIYHKMRLTPFAERIPYYEHLGFMEKFMNWGVGISSWGQGNEQKNLTLTTEEGKSYKVAPVICIESIFPDFVRKFTKEGANMLSIITNDSWYNYTTGPGQHWDIARVRAIENRRYVARAANSGVSGFISADGKELNRIDQYKPIADAMTIPMLDYKTFYVRHGEIVSIASFVLSLIIIIFASIWKKIKK